MRCSRGLAVPIALVGLALAGTPAYAETTHPFIGSFDGRDTSNGSFAIPGRVAVDQGSGDVYVVDVAAGPAGVAVQVFDSSGAFVRELSGASTPAGIFRFSRIGSSSVAVDSSGGMSDGDIYVADTRNGVVAVFDSVGYERQLTGVSAPTGVAVDQNGHVWVASSGTGEVHEFDAAGNLLQTWPTPYFSLEDIAIDSDSRVYLINGFQEVTRWTSAGGDETLITDSATGIAVDPDDDHLYVNKRDSITEYDETGTPVIDFGAGRVANSVGVAVHGASGKVFVTNSIPPRQVNVFGPLANVPRVGIGPASAITTTSATVSGTINPDGLAAGYQFEWGPDTDYGNVAPAAPVDIGDGTANVQVTAELSGLAPGTTYHYRLRGINAEGSNLSDDRTFTTTPLPSISDEAVFNVDHDSAAVHAWINPNGEETTYQFEYGPTVAYGSVNPTRPASIGSSHEKEVVIAQLDGLASATTYHYRVVARTGGGVSLGRDRRFTTHGRPCCDAAPPAPPAGSDPGSAVGPGNVAVTPTGPGTTSLEVSRITRRQIANWGTSGRLRLRVTIGGAGEVRARARAQLQGQWEQSTVARDSATTATAGVVTLTLRLSRPARRALSDFRLPVTIVVSGTGADGPRTMRVTLKKRPVG
jgi:SMP-30/Gluconolactonase/LRE-like region